MRRIDNRRKKFAWLLLLVYVPMLLAITFHHHSGAEETAASYCYCCVHIYIFINGWPGRPSASDHRFFKKRNVLKVTADDWRPFNGFQSLAMLP